MKSKTILILCLFFIAVNFLWVGASTELQDNQVSQKDTNFLVQEIGDYKKWTRVNAEPVSLDARIAAMCAPEFPAKKADGNPHKNKFIVVYVNAIGRQTMMTEKHPQFPQGSVIVKEKLTTQNSTTP